LVDADLKDPATAESGLHHQDAGEIDSGAANAPAPDSAAVIAVSLASPQESASNAYITVPSGHRKARGSKVRVAAQAKLDAAPVVVSISPAPAPPKASVPGLPQRKESRHVPTAKRVRSAPRIPAPPYALAIVPARPVVDADGFAPAISRKLMRKLRATAASSAVATPPVPTLVIRSVELTQEKPSESMPTKPESVATVVICNDAVVSIDSKHVTEPLVNMDSEVATVQISSTQATEITTGRMVCNKSAAKAKECSTVKIGGKVLPPRVVPGYAGPNAIKTNKQGNRTPTMPKPSLPIKPAPAAPQELDYAMDLELGQEHEEWTCVRGRASRRSRSGNQCN
jgi:hypothetical protein